MVSRPAFDTLTEIVDTCEAHGCSVQGVEVASQGTGVSAIVRADHPVGPEDMRVEPAGSDGIVSMTPASLARVFTELPMISAETTSIRGLLDGGTLRCDHEFILEAERTDDAEPAGASAIEATQPPPSQNGVEAEPTTEADPLAELRDATTPPYDDIPYLEALYEECATFQEMSERIDMDVVAETVRRYMIEAGVHVPETYDRTSGNAHAEPRENHERTAGGLDGQLVADGLGLPEGVGVKQLIDAIVGAVTVHQVTRDLGLSQAQTREILRQLGILEKILCRVGDDHGGPSREEVIQRLRRFGSN
jgi:hypothetical protein